MTTKRCEAGNHRDAVPVVNLGASGYARACPPLAKPGETARGPIEPTGWRSANRLGLAREVRSDTGARRCPN